MTKNIYFFNNFLITFYFFCKNYVYFKNNLKLKINYENISINNFCIYINTKIYN